MRVPRFLKWLMSILVCVSLFRAINGAGPISISDMLVDLQSFRFDLSAVEDLIDLFRSGSFSDGFASWDNTLDGLDGFFINIKNCVTSFFITLTSLLRSVVTALWSLCRETFKLLGQLLTLTLKVVGLRK